MCKGRKVLFIPKIGDALPFLFKLTCRRHSSPILIFLATVRGATVSMSMWIGSPHRRLDAESGLVLQLRIASLQVWLCVGFTVLILCCALSVKVSMNNVTDSSF